MAQWRSLVFWIGIATLSWPVAGAAQTTEGMSPGGWLDPARGTLGLNPARVRYALPCSLGSFLCKDAAASAPSGQPQFSERWAVELGHVQLARPERGGAARTDGLNVSLVGTAPLWSAARLDVYGKVGTAWGRTDPGAALGTAGESGFGVSYGAGLSWALSPRATATLGWESYDFRFAGGRDPVRATSLGLQWRY